MSKNTIKEETFKIEKNVPIPPIAGRGRKGSKYPIAELKVKDTIFLPGRTMSQASSIVAAAKKRSCEGRKFTLRTVEENGTTGVRIWRIA
jgi:hypothetical protein